MHNKPALLGLDMNEAMQDIKENCSRKTFSTVSALLENQNKIKRSQCDKQSQNQTISTKNLITRQRPDTDRSNSDQAIM